MGLDLPTVSSTLGPEWASLVNAALLLVDSHDHSSGNGAQVTPAGILINALLDMAGEALGDANSLQMRNRNSFDVSSSALGSLQVKDNDLYFINSSATAIQITDNSNLFNPGGKITVKTTPTTSYTVLQSDLAKMLLCNTTSNSYTITLPAAADGPLYVFVKDQAGNAQSNNITVDTTGGETIDGQSSQIIDYNYGMLGFISDVSSNWYVM